VSVHGRRNGDSALIAGLAAGAKVEDAARSAGMSGRTAYRRLEDPAFRRRVSEARGQALERALGRLADTSGAAAETLAALLSAESETARLGAARSILELGSKLRESAELEARIAALEAAAEQRATVRRVR